MVTLRIVWVVQGLEGLAAAGEGLLGTGLQAVALGHLLEQVEDPGLEMLGASPPNLALDGRDKAC